MSAFPDTCQLLSSYADDFTASESSADVSEAAGALTSHASEVVEWAAEKDLKISAPKSHVTLFTPDKRYQSNLHPPVIMDGSPLPLAKHPKILGVTFDTHFTFTHHVTSVVERASERLKILKALTGTTWGQQKETITMTFKSLVWSIFAYASPVWFPNISKESIKRLQVIQNAALKIGTGCHKKASEAHIHMESKILPVADSLALLCSQFLASALRPQHPSHQVVTQPPGPRSMKATLQSKFLPAIHHLLTGGITPPDEYNSIISTIHTEMVSNVIQNSGPNPVLQAPPPPVDDTERTLPRAHRATLSQLRSGWCSDLYTYKSEIDETVNPLCPSCGLTSHTTAHLFQCPAHPTDLKVEDLLERPVRAAYFVSTLPFFDRLPELPRPPPEPPPD